MVTIAPLTRRRRDEALAMAWIAVDASVDGRVCGNDYCPLRVRLLAAASGYLVKLTCCDRDPIAGTYLGEALYGWRWPLVPQAIVESAEKPAVFLGGRPVLGVGDDVVDLAVVGRYVAVGVGALSVP
jgi:hypothetical protein